MSYELTDDDILERGDVIYYKAGGRLVVNQFAGLSVKEFRGKYYDRVEREGERPKKVAPLPSDMQKESK